MNKLTLCMVMTLAAGALVVVGAAATWYQPQEAAQIELPRDYEDITLFTVPIDEGSSQQATFVLNHRTGWLTGNFINEQTGRFNYSWSRNLVADFFPSAKTPPPESILRIVTGPAELPLYGRVQQALGVIYVAEVSTSQVIAYRFERPVNAGANMRIERIDEFQFR
jgi:hypothetical protein